MATRKMTTVAIAILIVVLVASAFGIVWSRRRTRLYRDQTQRSDEPGQREDRAQDAEQRARDRKPGRDAPG